MISGGFERVVYAFKDTRLNMVYYRGLPVHQCAGIYDFTAKYLCDTLVSKTNAQYRDLAAEFLYNVAGDACITRSAGPRRYNYMARLQLSYEIQVYLIVPVYD